jgi:uncharacterized protein YycO
MKKKLSIVVVIVLLLVIGIYAIRNYLGTNRYFSLEKEVQAVSTDLQNGDIIFQVSQSSQCIAIQKATKSKYSHCGIIYEQDGKYYVYEAVQPVKVTPLYKWIARGKDGHFVVKRLKNADELLTPGVLRKMKSVGEQFYGKDYDLVFGWSDDKIYCSELVWKIYKRAVGVEVGKLQRLKEFNLMDDIVMQKLEERYGNDIPMDEIVISPVAVFDSDLLEVIVSN